MKLVIWPALVAFVAIASAYADQSEGPATSEAASIDMTMFCADNRVRRMQRFYPQRALNEEISGDVTLDCSFVTPDQPLSCQVVEETPEGIGFGVSALAIVCRRGVPVTGDTTQVYQQGDVQRARWPVSFHVD